MAKKKRRRAAGRRKTDNRRPGWVWMLMGLTVGLMVAGYVYLGGLRGPALVDSEPAAPVAVTKLEIPEPEPEPPAAEPEETAGITFDFYEMLPNLDVTIYEEEQPVAPKPVLRAPEPASAPASAPGIYILQAGSFSRFADANRRKAQMALLGVRADIKKGNAAGKTVYRVYTNPLDTPAEVNRVSNLLKDAKIEVLRKRVSD